MRGGIRLRGDRAAGLPPLETEEREPELNR